jgi:amino acid permease
MSLRKSLQLSVIVAAATIGSGMFALPYVIQTSGWLITLGYFVALIASVSVAHVIYLRTLATVDEKERLLGLAKKYFGVIGFWIGFLAVVIGLLLSFIAFLVLGTQFLRILFPALSVSFALGIFWFLFAYLIWMSEGRVAWLEVLGVTLVSCAIFFIFFSGRSDLAFANMPLAVSHNFFLPFGAVLYSLAGWTSVEQIYELIVKNGDRSKKGDLWIFVVGAALAGLLYWLFSFGVLGSTPRVAMDTISGIGGWPIWRRDGLALIGLLAIGVVSLPLARELRGALEKDLTWNSIVSRILIIFLPLAIVLSGFNNFLLVVSLAGGVFISTQYLLIISIGRRTLVWSRREKILLDLLSLIFIGAAVYEVVTFVVK